MKTIVIEWILARIKERTTWNGTTILVLLDIIWFIDPLVKFASWVGIAYAIWQIIQKEK